jgi:asparagine synthase (glutamine-hydrolysing)
MCGICGFINYNRRLHEGDKAIVEKMARKIIHRGPDEQNSLVFDNVALGFTRLSIIGLGNGMQPIYNEDKTLVLVCNGEIFNYIELTKLLKQRGHVFSTQSDVEVILHLYEDHGRDFLNQLNGQFAFALYDLRKKEIFCVRDQMGVIPFFYTVTDNTFIFGSEIKAILAHPAVKPEVDPVGLDQVMTFAGLISPRTMFRDIHSLENGHYITVDADGAITKKEYWDLVYPEAGAAVNEQSEKYYIDKLEEHFENSIKLRLRADVPSGFYLSGGLDSSMIAMKVGQLNKETRKDAFSILLIPNSPKPFTRS